MTGTQTIGYLPAFADELFIAAIQEVPSARLVVLDDPASITAHAQELDALVTGGNELSYSPAVAHALCTRAERLKWIQITTAGHDALARFGVPKGVHLTGNGGAFSGPVAEHAMALLLALSHGLPAALDATPRPRWDRNRVRPAFGLEDRTLAIVGFGGIGREVARRAKAFGLHVIGVSRSGRSSPDATEALPVTALSDVLPRVDAIVLCAPLTPDTLHLMNAHSIDRCKEGTLLINVGRGKLIDTDALLDALLSRRIGGAALDVVDPEPLPDEHPLWNAPNVIITPHVAPAGSPLAVQRIAELVAENTSRFVQNLPLQGGFELY